MIGQFKIIDKKDGETFVLAESCMDKSFQGQFYLPPLYRESCSELKNGDTVFGVLDDQSGFGAVLFKFDDNLTDGNSLTLSKDVNVKGKLDVKKDLNAHYNVTIDGKCSAAIFEKGQITLDMTQLALLFGAVTITSPAGACASVPVSPVTLTLS